MTHPLLARRRAERTHLIDVARRWAERAGPQLDAVAIVVVGSVARGDFNKWSDVDVLVIAENLPTTLAERLALMATTGPPPRLEIIAWTPTEMSSRRRRRNDPMATEAYDTGVTIFGTLPH